MVALANLGAWKSWTTALNQNCPVRSSSIHVDSGVVPKTLQCIRALHCLLPGSKSTNRRELARTTRWYAAIYGTTRLVIESYEEEIFNRKYLTTSLYLLRKQVPDETYFVADVESYTILFDHTAFAVNLNVTGGSRYAKGFIRTTNKQLCAVTPNSKPDPSDPSTYCLIEPNQTSTSLDIIQLGVLLGAGGTSLEEASGVSNGHTVSNRQSSIHLLETTN